MTDEFSELVYCDFPGGCTNAAIARVAGSMADVQGRPTCGDHLRQRTLLAFPPGSYREIQEKMNDRMAQAEAGGS
jgi:hypothetical protein